MRRVLSFLLAAGLAGPLSAQIESGYYTDGNGYTCEIEVSDTNGSGQPGVDVTLTDAGGSAVVTGTAGTGSSDEDPNAASFPSTTTPRGDTEVRGSGGAAQKKNESGEWVDLRKVKKPKKARADGVQWGGGHGAENLEQGQLAPFRGTLISHDGNQVVHLDQGDAAPFAGTLTPGDEVTSLPTVR